MIYRTFIKRLLDVVVALIALVILSPLLLALAILVYLKIGAPVLFRQPRPGLQGKPFTLLKFRTMTETRDSNGQLLPDRERLTAIGKALRAASFDELPELYNVLKGEMSLVGPRPLLMKYLDRYTVEQARRHEVKPGITGWAQVNGRNALGWEQKFALDLWYVENQSFRLDLKIMVLTIWKMIKREGISEPGHSTAREFMGSTK